ncbi:class I SAM-dependent methyltransferase [Actinophytocola sp.]|uniref:class I SAM-dependent methyltransferase n=1 Tax=Actinophytocola sp. TaxID=1872138 RepID=UPI00389B2FB3
MTDFPLDRVDFQDAYSGGAMVPGTDVTFDVMPWDIGAPQPVVVRLADEGEFRGAVLDAGCGLGNNAIFLAQRGFQVTGVDGAEAALQKARERAASHGVDVEFVRADVTTFEGVAPRFDTVLDSALYHCLTGEQRTAYAAALHRVTRPGARLHLLCFADAGNDGLDLPMTVSQDDLRTHLSDRWLIRDIEAVDYTISMSPEAFARSGGARMGFGVDPDVVQTDEHGRILTRMWHLSADRA